MSAILSLACLYCFVLGRSSRGAQSGKLDADFHRLSSIDIGLPWLSQVVNNSGSWTRILRFLFALLRLGINHNMDRADLDLRYAACISYHPFVYRLGQSTGPINLRLGRNRNYLVQIQNRFLNKCKITKKFKPVVPSIRPWPWPTMLNVPSESTRKL